MFQDREYLVNFEIAFICLSLTLIFRSILLLIDSRLTLNDGLWASCLSVWEISAAIFLSMPQGVSLAYEIQQFG